MAAWLFEAGVAVASIGGWFAAYGVALVLTRPRRVSPAPAAQELGPEPPAVASLLANGWDVTEDAVEATLLDLGARKLFEFRQPANDPHQTTIHLTSKAAPPDLTHYERAVFDRVKGLATTGLVPLTALTFRDPAQARTWWKGVRRAIIGDARARGLSQRRFGKAVLGVLGVLAFLAAIGVAVAVTHFAIHHPSDSDDDNPVVIGLIAGMFAFFGLAGYSARDVGERDTAAGREVAARWLGVRQWLRDNDGFADLPPASVAVWDRYLGYGAAVGVTRVASAVIDLGMGNRRRVWSSFGGTWHRVRISYPRGWPHYGQPARRLVLRAVISGLVGYVLVRWWGDGIGRLSTVDFVNDSPARSATSIVSRVGLLVGAALLAYGLYALIRVALDALTLKTFTGQVLWTEVWRSNSGGEDRPSIPWLHYAAIDDGAGDRTRAWGLPNELRHRCDTGDTVTVTVRRWSRRIMTAEVVEHAAAAYRSAYVPGEVTATPASTTAAAVPGLGVLGGLLSAPGFAASGLLTVEEVGQAMGAPVLIGAPLPGPVSITQFQLAQGRRTVLMVQAAHGTLAGLAWRRAAQRGQALPGIGDGAMVDGARGMARAGETVITLTLLKQGRQRTAQLPWLLRQAVSRVPRQTPAAD